MKHLNDVSLLMARAQTAEAFRDWLRADADRLIDACALLGGPSWSAAAADLVEVIAGGVDPADHLDDLGALRRLLSLEPTDDLMSPEAIRFMLIDPDDPRADDARLCAEALERGVDALAGGQMRETA